MEITFLQLNLSSKNFLNAFHSYFTISYNEYELNRFTSTTFIISPPSKELTIEIWEKGNSIGFFDIVVPEFSKDSEYTEEMELENGKLLLNFQGKTIKQLDFPISLPKNKESLERKAVKSIFKVYFSFTSPHFDLKEEMFTSDK